MPKMIPLWICARTVSGLTTVPQSTAQTTRRTRTAPSFATSAGLLRGEREDRFRAGGLVEESEPIGDRVLLRRRRQLVDEAFGHKHIVRRPDAAPERDRNARRLDPHILDMHVR